MLQLPYPAVPCMQQVKRLKLLARRGILRGMDFALDAATPFRGLPAVLLQVGIRPSGGLRLWDIRFNGERIVYELALQEAMMSAAGTTPSQVLCCDTCACT